MDGIKICYEEGGKSAISRRFSLLKPILLISISIEIIALQRKES